MKFSIIIPVYNVEKYLHETIKSVIAQTLLDFEVLLINDGSKDQSGKICDYYSEKYAFIKTYHKENGGQSSARNLGIVNSAGEYIIFLDSDDMISSNSFLADLEEKTIDNPDLILYKYQKYYDVDQNVADSEFDYPDLLDNNLNNNIERIIKNDAFYCSAWTKAIKANILRDKEVYFKNGIYAEDIEWYYRLLKHVKCIEIINKPYIFYRQRENSITSTKSLKNIVDNANVIESSYIYILDNFSDPMRTALLHSLAKMYANLIINYSSNPNKNKNLKAKIKELKILLSFNWNPRVNKFRIIKKVIGLNGLILLIKLYKLVKK